MNLFSDAIETNEEDQIRLINLLASNLNLKPLKVIAKELDKSYNGLKNYGNPVIIAGKYFGVSKEDDFLSF
jgi:hypothetical protein